MRLCIYSVILSVWSRIGDDTNLYIIHIKQKHMPKIVNVNKNNKSP